MAKKTLVGLEFEFTFEPDTSLFAKYKYKSVEELPRWLSTRPFSGTWNDKYSGGILIDLSFGKIPLCVARELYRRYKNDFSYEREYSGCTEGKHDDIMRVCFDMIPDFLAWYDPHKEMENITQQVEDRLETFRGHKNPTNEMCKNLVRYLNKLHIADVNDTFQEFLYKNVAKELGNNLSVPVKYVARFSPRIGHISKTKHGWYLKFEYQNTTNRHSIIGMELTSPPLPVGQAKKALTKVCEVLEKSALSIGFIDTACDSGVHINVSVSTLRDIDFSATYAVLMSDRRPFGYNRSAEIRSYETTKCIETDMFDVLVPLIEYGFITPDLLDTNEGIIKITQILDLTGWMNSSFVRFDKVHSYRYVEYRYPGGRRYPTKTKLLCDDVDRLVTLTESMRGYWLNQEYVDRLTKLVKRAHKLARSRDDSKRFKINLDERNHTLWRTFRNLKLSEPRA